MMDTRRATNRAMFWRIIRRLFGANVVISSSESSDHQDSGSLNPSILDKIPGSYEGGEMTKVGFIYVVIAASVRSKPYSFDDRQKSWNALPEPPTAKGYKTPEPDTSSDRPSKWSSVIL